MSKVILQSQNKAGKWYRLVQRDNDNFSVYARSVNYRQGKDVASWRFCVPKPRSTPHKEAQRIAREGMDYDVAHALYNKLIKGSRK